MRALLPITLSGLVLLLAGCKQNTDKFGAPDNITLENAMASVANGLVAMDRIMQQPSNDASQVQPGSSGNGTTAGTNAPLNPGAVPATNAATKPLKTGLIPTDIEIVFNISADAKDTQNAKLTIEAGATVAETLKIAKVGGDAGWSTEISAKRGNTVTVKFKNLAVIAADAAALAKLWDALEARGARIYTKPPGGPTE